MRQLLIVILFFIISGNISAQTDSLNTTKEIKTLFKKRPVIGGFGALVYKYSSVDGRNTFINGGKGAWLINHSIGFGFAGYAFKTESEPDNMLGNVKFRYNGGYGGILIEPIVFARHLLHINFPLLIGGGGITYKKQTKNAEEYYEDRNAFFVLEPGIDLEINVFKFMRLAIGVSYRVTSDLNLDYVDGGEISKPDILNGASYGIALKFGKF